MPKFSIPYVISGFKIQTAKDNKKIAFFDINRLAYKILISGFSDEELRLYDVLKIEQDDDNFNKWYEETFKPVFEAAIHRYMQFCKNDEYNLFTDTIEFATDEIDIVEYYKRIRTAQRIVK